MILLYSGCRCYKNCLTKIWTFLKQNAAKEQQEWKEIRDDSCQFHPTSCAKKASAYSWQSRPRDQPFSKWNVTKDRGIRLCVQHVRFNGLKLPWWSYVRNCGPLSWYATPVTIGKWPQISSCHPEEPTWQPVAKIVSWRHGFQSQMMREKTVEKRFGEAGETEGLSTNISIQ